MRFTRKTRRVGDSLTIAIPSQLAVVLDLGAGEEVEFDYLWDSMRLKKVKKEDRVWS